MSERPSESGMRVENHGPLAQKETGRQPGPAAGTFILPPAPSLTFRLDALVLASAYARAYRAKKAER